MSYKPIDCNLYDVYEAYATLQTLVRIRYRDSDFENVTISKIVTLETRNKEEYIVLENSLRIRLDTILTCMPHDATVNKI